MAYSHQIVCPKCAGDGSICEICDGPISGCSVKGNHDANRTIEMYCLSDGGDSGTWTTVSVEVPADTHESQLEAVARTHAEAQYGPGAYMMYNSMDDEVMDDEVPDTHES